MSVYLIYEHGTGPLACLSLPPWVWWIRNQMDSLGVWYSICKVMWLGGPFKYWTIWTINRLFFSPVFRPSFKYWTIWQQDTNLPFKYQTSPVFRWLLCLKYWPNAQNLNFDFLLTVSLLNSNRVNHSKSGLLVWILDIFGPVFRCHLNARPKVSQIYIKIPGFGCQMISGLIKILTVWIPHRGQPFEFRCNPVFRRSCWVAALALSHGPLSYFGSKWRIVKHLVSYKSFAQAWTVMVMELSIDFPWISPLG